jgi:DNA invertase Pin-like site-specific DNA recombinase
MKTQDTGGFATDAVTAVVYGRVSTNKQADSLDLQEKRAVEYVDHLNSASAGVFLDEDESGSVPFFNRPTAQRLFATVQANPNIKHFVVGCVDRLGRNARDLHNAKYAIEQAGLSLHILDNGFGKALHSDDPMDQFQFSLWAALANMELLTIKKRIQTRVDENFDNRRLIGTVPYGHDKVQDGTHFDRATAKEKPSYMLVPNPAEQAVILRMERQEAAGCSDYEIATQLNTDGIPTKIPAGTRICVRRPNPRAGFPGKWGLSSGKWQASQVRKILDSRHTARFLAEKSLQNAA